MHLERYLGLYLSESREHLRTLNRELLELEAAGGGAPLDAAFRAAHTLKGMAATMGHDAVARIAHALEDRLDDVRAGRLAVDGSLVDSLLRQVDLLEEALEKAVAAPADADESTPEPVRHDGGYDRESVHLEAPAGTALIVRVAIAPRCALKAARAMIVVRNAGNAGKVLGTLPSTFDEDFDGVLYLFLAPGANLATLEKEIRAAGEVTTVQFDAPKAASPVADSAPDDGGQAAGGGAHGPRFVRVDWEHLEDVAAGVGDLAILSGRLERLTAGLGDGELNAVVEDIARRVRELQGTVQAVRMVPVSDVFDRFPRLVRDAARTLGKEIDFRLEGRDIELDREILEALADPLVHLLRNAVDHGLETPTERRAAGKPPRGRLVLEASRERTNVVIRVEDDGRGVDREKVRDRARSLGLLPVDALDEISDEELLRLLSQPGLTTADRVSGMSGRGVGMDAVVNRIRRLGGAITMQTRRGVGTTITIRLPVTLASTLALRVRVGGEDYMIPLTHISEVVHVEADDMVEEEAGTMLMHRGEPIPLVRLAAVVGAEDGRGDAAVITELGERLGALVVDELVGREQVVVRGFDAATGTLPIFSGATLLADGRPALVLDPISVF